MNIERYRLNVIKKLFPYLKTVKLQLFITSICGIFITGLSFINPHIYKIFINHVIINKELSLIVFIILAYIIVYIVELLIKYIHYFYSCKAIHTVKLKVKEQIWLKYLNLSFNHIETANIGDMKLRLDADTEQISSFMGQQSFDYYITIFKLAISIILLISTNWQLSILVMFVIPLTLYIDKKLATAEETINDKTRKISKNQITWLQESLSNWREIRMLNLYKIEKIQFIKFLREKAMCNAKWINYWTARRIVIPKLKDEFFMQFFLYFIGGILILFNHLDVSDMLVFVSYYAIFSSSINFISTANADLQSNIPLINGMIDGLKDNSSHSHISNKRKIHNIDSITFKDVSFSYEKNHPIISNLNFRIEKGEHVAIIGKSGTGKTTILKLLVGMLVPQQGTIKISNVDICEADLTELYPRIGYVLQDSKLFNTSIRENLLYGLENASEDDMVIACKKASIYDYIVSLPNGFDTIIGEQGVKLSGGQKQRIVLARLFIRDVDIFIFDEATSAIDPQNENLIKEVINCVARNKMVIVVSHRQSTNLLYDKTIVLDNQPYPIILHR